MFSSRSDTERRRQRHHDDHDWKLQAATRVSLAEGSTRRSPDRGVLSGPGGHQPECTRTEQTASEALGLHGPTLQSTSKLLLVPVRPLLRLKVGAAGAGGGGGGGAGYGHKRRSPTRNL